MRKYLLPFFFLLAVVVGGGLLFLPAKGYAKIILTEPARDRVILAVVVREEEEATYAWTNSIYRIPVREVYVLQDGNLILRKILSGEVEESSAPSVSAEEAQDLYHPGDVFFTEDMNRPFQHIVFRVGEIGKPRFEVMNKTVDFKAEVGFGGQVVLDVRPVRVYEVLLSRLGIP